MANVVLVEDVEALRQNLTILLTRNGHVVRAAANGHEALRLVAEKTPDLLVTDLFMPEKDGIEIIQEIRRLHPQLRIIAMSGGIRGDQDVFLTMAQRLGVNATISKPFSIQDFQATVDKVLGSSS
ncbi:MAG: response regulator [Verrucomicrobiota bacterium]